MIEFKLPYIEPMDETIIFIDKWYDKHTKLWVIQCKNKDGDQIGSACYLDKKGAKIEYKRLLKEYNLN